MFSVSFSSLSRILFSFLQDRMGGNNRASNERAYVCKSHNGRMCLGSTRGMDNVFSFFFCLFFPAVYAYLHTCMPHSFIVCIVLCACFAMCFVQHQIVLELMTAISIDFHCIFIVIHLECDAYLWYSFFFVCSCACSCFLIFIIIIIFFVGSCLICLRQFVQSDHAHKLQTNLICSCYALYLQRI